MATYQNTYKKIAQIDGFIQWLDEQIELENDPAKREALCVVESELRRREIKK